MSGRNVLPCKCSLPLIVTILYNLLLYDWRIEHKLQSLLAQRLRTQPVAGACLPGGSIAVQHYAEHDAWAILQPCLFDNMLVQ